MTKSPTFTSIHAILEQIKSKIKSKSYEIAKFGHVSDWKFVGVSECEFGRHFEFVN